MGKTCFRRPFLFSNNRLNTIYGIKLLYNCIYFTRYGI